MRLGRTVTAAVLAGLLALSASGCAQGPLAAGSATSAGRMTAANPNTPALISQREAAGIPDCDVPTEGAPGVPDGLPAVVLPCLGSARSVDLAQLRGRPLVVNLWAQWCEPCKAEAPVLAEFARRASGKVLMLGVDFDDPDPAAAIAFAQRAGWTYPHLIDADGSLRKRMTLPGIPVTLLVSAQGRVVYRFTGGIPSADRLADVVQDRLGVSV